MARSSTRTNRRRARPTSTRSSTRSSIGPFGNTRVAIRGSWDSVSYDGIYPYAPEAEGQGLLVLSDSAVGTRLTFDGRATRTLPYRQTLTVGVEYLDNLRQDQWLSYNTPDMRAD